MSAELVRLRDALNVVLERQPMLEVWLYVVVKNESNLRDRWGAVKRAKCHRGATRLGVTAALRRGTRPWVSVPHSDLPAGVVVLLTRTYSGRGRAMDSDGVARSLKAVRDGVADALGVDDGDVRVTWVTTQERGEKTWVKVSIFERAP